MNDVSRYDPLQGAPLPVLGAWGEDEYRSLGLMSGRGVHQQLLTSRKLFRRCPAGRDTGEQTPATPPGQRGGNRGPGRQ